jgi:hypothetical protein
VADHPDDRRILDASSGGAMVASLGYGVPELVAAAAEQADRIAYFYNHHFTSERPKRSPTGCSTVAAPRWRVCASSRGLRGERDRAPAREAVPRGAG